MAISLCMASSLWSAFSPTGIVITYKAECVNDWKLYKSSFMLTKLPSQHGNLRNLLRVKIEGCFLHPEGLVCGCHHWSDLVSKVTKQIKFTSYPWEWLKFMVTYSVKRRCRATINSFKGTLCPLCWFSLHQFKRQTTLTPFLYLTLWQISCLPGAVVSYRPRYEATAKAFIWYMTYGHHSWHFCLFVKQYNDRHRMGSLFYATSYNHCLLSCLVPLLSKKPSYQTSYNAQKPQMHPEDALVSSNPKKLSLGISMMRIQKVHVQLTLDRSHNYDIIEAHPY